MGNLLNGKAPPATIARVAAPLLLVTTTITETGAAAADQGGVGPLIVPMAFAILSYLT